MEFEEGTPVISQFRGPYRFLSNFWQIENSLTSEHYYQAAKTEDRDQHMSILQCETPGEAKRLGQAATLRPDWDDIKLDVMRGVLKWKFQDPELRRLLLDTGEAILIEGNTWGDTYWGVDLRTGEGENNLGILLMELREQFKNG